MVEDLVTNWTCPVCDQITKNEEDSTESITIKQDPNISPRFANEDVSSNFSASNLNEHAPNPKFESALEHEYAPNPKHESAQEHEHAPNPKHESAQEHEHAPNPKHESAQEHEHAHKNMNMHFKHESTQEHEHAPNPKHIYDTRTTAIEHEA